MPGGLELTLFRSCGKVLLATIFISRYNTYLLARGRSKCLSSRQPSDRVRRLLKVSGDACWVNLMITCERCNTENIDGAQYCDECGAPLIPSAPDKKGGGTSNTGGGTAGEGLGKANGPIAAGQPALSHAVSSGSIALMDGAHSKLVIERGRSAGKQFPLSDDESQIGRWDADGGIFPDVDLDADDPEAKVSRRHARIMRRNDKYFVEDLGSTNGTFINRGRRLLPGDRQPLQDGDEIIVGKTFLRFHIVK